MLKMIILPRQARDRHRESTQERDAFLCQDVITNQSAIMGVWYPDYADAAPMTNTPPPAETDTHGFPRTDSRCGHAFSHLFIL